MALCLKNKKPSKNEILNYEEKIHLYLIAFLASQSDKQNVKDAFQYSYNSCIKNEIVLRIQEKDMQYLLSFLGVNCIKEMIDNSWKEIFANYFRLLTSWEMVISSIFESLTLWISFERE